MRVKSEAKRKGIIDAAAEIFMEQGFTATSMSEIASRAGGSKATLYSYFPSKEELFFAVVLDAAEAEFQATLAALDPTLADITQALESFGQRFLSFLYSPRIQAFRRLLVSEAGRSDLGKKCYELGPVRSDAAVAGFLQEAMDQGKLRPADPRIAALHLKGLLEAEWIERFIFQTLDAFTQKEVASTVRRAVSVFMAAYGPAGSPDHPAAQP